MTARSKVVKVEFPLNLRIVSSFNTGVIRQNSTLSTFSPLSLIHI